MPMATIYLITCTKTKDEQAGPHRAQELYTSDYFTKMREFARLRADHWYILSDKYGLVRPDEMIYWYEEDLKKLSNTQRLQWAEGVLKALSEQTTPGDTIVMVAGSTYVRLLEPELTRQGYIVEDPMKGLRIGERKQWLKRAISKAHVGR